MLFLVRLMLPERILLVFSPESMHHSVHSLMLHKVVTGRTKTAESAYLIQVNLQGLVSPKIWRPPVVWGRLKGPPKLFSVLFLRSFFEPRGTMHLCRYNTDPRSGVGHNAVETTTCNPVDR